MKTNMIKVVMNIAMATALLCATQACTTAPGITQANAVAAAYETSGVVSVSPYNRSIFSSTNF